MAGRIKGITVEIGGDTKGLNDSLKGVNKEIKNTQSQLKDVERLLKLDPTNTNLLQQRQRLLAQAVEETSNKLDALKEAEKQVQQQVAEGKASQDQYEGLQREIIATEQELKRLEDASASSNAALSRVSAVADQVADATGKIANKTKALSGAAAGVLGAGIGAAVSSGKSADDINTMSKQSGFSTDLIQMWEYASDRIDVDINDIVKSAQKLKRNMVSTSSDVTDAWNRLGVSVVDSNGNLRDSSAVFDEVVRALSGVSNETERDTLAMTLLGKSADSLAGLIDDGGAAFRQFGQEAKDAGLILDQDALNKANEFNDAIDKLKAETSGTFATVGTEIAEMLLPFMDDLGEAVSGALEWLRSLDEDQLKMLGTILLVIAGISPVLGIISSISSGVSGVIGAIQGIIGVLPALQSVFTSVFSFIAANPIVLLIAAIVALVALIATKGDEIQAMLQKVDDFLQGIFATDWTNIFGPVLGSVLNAFFANLKNIWDAVKQIFNGVIDFIRGVFSGDWDRAWKGIVEMFSGIWDGLVAIAKWPINQIIGFINSAIGGVNMLIDGLNMIPGVSVGHIGQIPLLAKGGIVKSGSAIVGDAGPELLTVSGGRAIVQPLNVNTGRIEGMLGNISGQLGQYANPETPFVVRVELDGDVVGEAAFNYGRRRARACGN